MKKEISVVTMTAALIVTLLAGCISDVEEDGRKGQNDMIKFTPMKIMEVNTSRATQTIKNTIAAYRMSASIYPAGSTYTAAYYGSFWINKEIEAETGYSGYYWPGENYKVSFFAYAPYVSNVLYIMQKEQLENGEDKGYPIYRYTVPEDITEQVDFITANIIDHSGTPMTEPVPLTFSHQLADIRFNVYNQGNENIIIHSISLYGVKFDGCFSEKRNPKWSFYQDTEANSSTDHPFTLTLGTTVNAGSTADVTGTDKHLMMIPQTIDEGTEIIDVDATVNETREHYRHVLTADLTLEAAKSYTVTVTLGGGPITVDTESDIQDWEVETTYITANPVDIETAWPETGINSGSGIGVTDWEEE